MITLAAEFPNDNPDLSAGARWICPAVTGRAVAELPPRPVVSSAAPRPRIVAVMVAPVPAAEPAEATHVEPRPVTRDTRESGVVLAAAEALDEALDDASEDLVVEELEPIEAVVLEGATAEPPPVVAAEPAPEPVVTPEPARAPVTLPPPPEDPYRAFVNALVDVALAIGSPSAAAAVVPLLDGAMPPSLSPEQRDLLLAAGAVEGDAPSASFESVRVAFRDILRGTSDDFGACGATMLDDWAADLVARLAGSLAQVSTVKRELRARGVAAFGMTVAA